LHDQVPGKILADDGLSLPPEFGGTGGVTQESDAVPARPSAVLEIRTDDASSP